MIRTWLAEEGKVREGGVALAVHTGIRWVDVEAQTAEDVVWLGETFGFHPLALEDLLHLDQRPKIDDYPSALFLVLHSFTTPAGAFAPQMHEVHAFLTSEVLVTVHTDPVPALAAVQARVLRDPALLAEGADSLLHEVCDAIVDSHFPLVDRLHEELEELEERVLRAADPAIMERIFDMRRMLMALRRTLAPARDVFLALSKPGGKRVSEKIALYFRDVLDHTQRNTEALDAARELLADILAAHHSGVANRTNQVVKRLTVFSAMLLPLTFITGFFGMNFTDIPFGSHELLVGSLAAIVALPAATVVAFRLARWI